MRRLQERILAARWTTGSSAIWLLGICYDVSLPDEQESKRKFEEFISDFSSRIWITYRQGFEPLGEAKLTSDLGWGCMLRSGQMLLAQALSSHHLGRGWRRKKMKQTAQDYLQVLQYIWDSPGKRSSFSIHNIVQAGRQFGLRPGSWLGPYGFCRAVETLSNSTEFQHSLPFRVYLVVGDENGERGGAPVLYMNEVRELCSSQDEWYPLLILVPLVLGIDKINPRYLPSLYATFTFPQTVGIAGGRPGASVYFLGFQDDQILYLDPHEIQQALDLSSDIDTSSYHTNVVRRMPLESIDPSLALGFYTRNKDEFDDLRWRLTELVESSKGAPMFTLADKRTSYMEPAAVRTSVSEGDWELL